MRTFLLILLHALGIGANAQNWALLNPAYKYNYSNDGSDTISNQIFVTHIDTLGVDSFRYELNGVAKLCDTCAGPQMYLWTNSPQFLQRSVNVGSGVWHFHDPGSFVVLPGAPLGASWLFDTLANVQATVTLIDTVDQFGSPVGRKTIALSDGGQLMISEAYGILSWNEHALIGVQGPQVGRVIPSLQEFFPFTSGDIVQYRTGLISCSPCWGNDSQYKFTFGPMGSTDSSIVYDGWLTSYTHFFQEDFQGNASHWYEYENGQNSWTASSAHLPFLDLVRSYPGGLVRKGTQGEEWCIAQHSIDSLGRYRIECEVEEGFHVIGLGPTDESGLSAWGGNDQCPDLNGPCGASYVAGIGLNYFIHPYFDGYAEYVLDGAVISGDTIGTLLTDDQLLAVHDNASARRTLIHPNPVSERLTFAGSRSSPSPFRVLTSSGVPLMTGTFQSANGSTLDVNALPSGPYVLEVKMSDGMVHERFIIAR